MYVRSAVVCSPDLGRSLKSLSHAAEELRHALGLMQAAIAIIDKAGSADEAGAHLDLAICRLTGLIGSHGSTPVRRKH